MNKYGVSAQDIQKGLRETKSYDGIFGELRFGEKQCVVKPLMWKTVRGGEYAILSN